MKHLKRFNESIVKENPKVIIDQVLDRLSSKGKLSNSEKEFLDGASKGIITDVTIPKSSGNFWSDMANPHNLGIMYNINGAWKVLKSVEEEEDEDLEKTEDSNQTWERKRQRQILKYSEENPGLKEALNKYFEFLLKKNEESKKFITDIRKFRGNDYNLSQKIDYALKDIHSMMNQFDEILDWKYDEDGEFKKKS